MRILVLSYYYHPDLSAGSFRVTSLMKELMKILPEGVHVDVLTTLPNRYNSFSVKSSSLETLPSLTIHRLAVSSHQCGTLDQAKNFTLYSYQVLKLVKDQDYDLVFATSSRLMTAVLAALIAKKKKTKLYLDIRDIFADTIKDITAPFVSWFLNFIFSILEKWTIKTADKVNLVSPGFGKYFKDRYPQKKFSYFTNGIEELFLAPLSSEQYISLRNPNNPLKVVYAGNIGDGQGLNIIIPYLSKKLEGHVEFEIIGDGSERLKLQENLEKNNVSNVKLLPPMLQKDLKYKYMEADILFLHLNDYEAFDKVIPSKLFEYGATGKPIWGGLSGYSAHFSQSEIDNIAIFHPGCHDEAIEVLHKLKLEMIDRTEFKRKFNRKKISKDLAKDIIDML